MPRLKSLHLAADVTHSVFTLDRLRYVVTLTFDLERLCWHLQMKIVSIAYFLAFGIFVPMASHMIIYGLYLLRTYLLEHAVTEVATRGKISEMLMDKMSQRAKSVMSLVAKPKSEELKRLGAERYEQAKRSPSPAAAATSGQANVLHFESGGRKVRLKSIFSGSVERRRSVHPSSELNSVISEAAVEEQ